MSWHHLCEDHVHFVRDDEKILREAWHTDADLRQTVMKELLTSIAAPRIVPVARNITTASAPDWLMACWDRALVEISALADSKDAPHCCLKMRRTGSSHNKMSSTSLDGSARVIGVESGGRVVLGDLDGHLVRLHRADAHNDEDSASLHSCTSTVSDNAAGDYYILLLNQKDELEVFGLTPWPFQGSLQASSPRSREPLRSADAQQATSARHNFFACLSEDDQNSGCMEDCIQTPTVVQRLDLHGLKVAEAIDKVDAALARHARGASVATSKTSKSHVHLIVGVGKHSDEGIAQIKPCVLDSLRKRGVSCGTLRSNPGIVWVDTDTVHPSRLATNSVNVTTYVDDLGYIGDVLHLLMAVHRQLRRGTWPRITDALASPNARTLLPATLFKGRCAFDEVQFPAGTTSDVYQLDAMRSITHNLSAIQGPPGTGKTTLIANVLAFAIPQLTTLVTSVQNKALDPLAHKLAAAHVDFVVIAREEDLQSVESVGGSNGGALGASTTNSKLGPKSRLYTLSAIATREFPMSDAYAEAVRRLMKVVASGRVGVGGKTKVEEEKEVDRGMRFGELLKVAVRRWRRLETEAVMRRLETEWRAHAERAILARASVFLSTIDRAHIVHKLLYERGRPLEVLIVDEAGAVPDWKMPLLSACGGRRDTRGGPAAPELIVLVGDQKQLPPFSRARFGSPPVSALERMERAMPAGSIKMLRSQYRMPPEVCEFLSRRFYGGLLVTAPEKLRFRDTDLPALEWHSHNERETQEGTSFFNDKEIDMVADLLTSPSSELYAARLAANAENVIVITFYSEQARRLQSRLRTTCPFVSVMTVDSSQGSEADYVLLSCVRCNHSRNIGHVADKHRFNVALSRARKRLIVVGSDRTMVRPWGGEGNLREAAGAAGAAGDGADIWHAFKAHLDACCPVPSEERNGNVRDERYAGYKVTLCNKFRSGACGFGATCAFAHGEAELRCREWTQHKVCPQARKGRLCKYKHCTEDPSAATRAMRLLVKR
jgi:hypothetical protein